MGRRRAGHRDAGQHLHRGVYEHDPGRAALRAAGPCATLFAMRVTKMHGAGNDYIFHRPTQERDWPDISRRISDRHFGIGSDGLILALPSDTADLRMRMFNPDGSESEMCGNGIRCLARFAVEKGIVPASDTINVATGAGRLRCELHRAGGHVARVRVSMGRPRLTPAEIPVVAESSGPVLDLPVAVDGGDYHLTCVSMGNPHAVHYTDEPVESIPLERTGPLVEHHLAFPRRVNFEVV